MSEAEMFKYSGFRLDPTSRTWGLEFETLVNTVLERAGVLIAEALLEPYLFDDRTKENPLKEIVKGLVINSEVFVVELERQPVAYAAWRNIRANHRAELEIYVHPSQRKTYLLHEMRTALADYAFAPLPEGLGLIKMTATVHRNNYPALRALKQSGFELKAELPFHGWFEGQTATMLYLERYHPSVSAQMNPVKMELKKSGKPTQRPQSTPAWDQQRSKPELREPRELHLPESVAGAIDPLQRTVRANKRKLPERVHSSK